MSFRLTERDRELLALLYCHRLVLARQLVALGFFGSLVRCNARLRRLRETGYLLKAFVPSVKGTQAVHRVSKKAARIVAEETGLDIEEVRRTAARGFSLLQLEHCVRTTDLRSQCERDGKSLGIETEWTAETLCRHEYSVRRGDGWQKRVFKPDGLLRLINEASSQTFFVEVDLGTVSHKRFSEKVQSYCQYTGEVFQETYGEESFSVLVVTTGERRLTRLASLVKDGAPQLLFTTHEELKRSSVFDPVWTEPGSDERVPLLDAEEVPQ